MAYNFVGASTQYLFTSSSPVTTTPCTIACWAVRDLTASRGLAFLTSSTNANARFGLLSTNSFLVAAQAADDVNATAESVVGVASTGTLFHAAGVYTSSTSRTAYADGVAGNANGANINVTGLDRIVIGARFSGTSTVGNAHDGLIAEVGIWNVALTPAEIASLAKGVTCDKVRPQSLKFYAPLIRDLQDVRDGLTITNTNSATVADHPRVYK
jgi:hypothetical protein